MNASWELSIARADTLAAQGGAARELLAFYAKLLRAQKQAYEVIRDGPLSGMLDHDLPAIRPLLSVLVQTVQSAGPAMLATEAGGLLQKDESELDSMLLGYWHAPSDMQFFAKALLQPYARWLAEKGIQPAGREMTPRSNRCPFCGGKPQAAFIKTANGAGCGSRNLVCAACLTDWPFRRVVCASCGEERPAKLGLFHSPTYDHVRMEACDTCGYYIKSIDLTRAGLAIPLVDEVAAASLDVWAGEHGYTKIERNLVGL